MAGGAASLSDGASSNGASDRVDLKALSFEDLESFVQNDLKQPAFRARQIFKWVHQRGVHSFDQMTDLSKALRETLATRASLPPLMIHRVERAADGTRKYALKTYTGDIVESVFIPDASADGRNTLCISSQVGCAIDCKFCLTATLGLLRNLHFGEIVEQITRVKEDLASDGAQDPPAIHNIVMMGMGEPLQNYDQLLLALQTMTSDLGHGLSTRRVTVSTAGLVPRIAKLGRDIPVNLAVSLNATTDEVRDRIMPINKRWPIAALLDACRKFPLPTRRRITFEYVLLAGINDTNADARRLVKLLRGIRCKINLIPFNEHPYSPFKQPDARRVAEFQRIVGNQGYSVFVRTPRGDDISAACGQLGAEVDAPRKLHVIQA